VLCSQVDPCEWQFIAQSRDICLHEHVIRRIAAIAIFLFIAPGFIAGLIGRMWKPTTADVSQS
jgi:hypothetical protein